MTRNINNDTKYNTLTVLCNDSKKAYVEILFMFYRFKYNPFIIHQLIVWIIQMLLFTKTRKVHEAKNPSSTSDILQDVALKTKTH